MSLTHDPHDLRPRVSRNQLLITPSVQKMHRALDIQRKRARLFWLGWTFDLIDSMESTTQRAGGERAGLLDLEEYPLVLQQFLARHWDEGEEGEVHGYGLVRSKQGLQQLLKLQLDSIRVRRKFKVNWRKSEVVLLLSLASLMVASQGRCLGDLDLEDWSEVAGCLPGRKSKDCYFKYRTLLKLQEQAEDRRWSLQESRLLRSIVDSLLPSQINWTRVAKLLFEGYGSSRKVLRTGKDCHDQYACYLSPSCRDSEWTPAEDALLLRLNREMGRSWTSMEPHLPGRSQRSIRERFKLLKQRILNGQFFRKCELVQEETDLFNDAQDQVVELSYPHIEEAHCLWMESWPLE